MPRKDLNGDYLTPQEVADILLVSPVTVRQWAQKGMLKAEMTPGGHRRFARDEVERFARQRGLKSADGQYPYRILVVDDNEPFSAFLGKLLHKLPFPIELVIAHDGFDAGRKMVTWVPDVVVMDLKMPGMDGFAVCKQIKSDALTRHVRVIAMTGYYTTESARRVTLAGAEACLAKPFDNNVLLELVGKDRLANMPPDDSLA